MRLASYRRLTVFAGLLALACVTLPSRASETKTYVVSWFVQAMYSQKGDCPNGENPTADGLLRQIMREQGVPEAKIKKVMAGKWERAFPKYAPDRGRINGKPVNVYRYPMTAPDPPIKTVVSRYAIGFNLDGKDGPNDYIDPLTHQRGVDNQLSRVMGCYQRLRGSPDTPSTGWMLDWNGVREGMPAWLVQVTTHKNGDAEVRFLQATEPVTKNIAGDVRPYMSYTIDPDPRTAGDVFYGHINKDGMFVSDERKPVHFYMVADAYIQPQFDVTDARLRLSFKKGGGIVGYLGGYTTIQDTYIQFSESGAFTESTGGIDAPGVYQAMRKYADGPLNPKTGIRDRISATYQVVAVPAFASVPRIFAKSGVPGGSAGSGDARD